MPSKETIYPREFARDTLSRPTDTPEIKKINQTICNLSNLITVNMEKPQDRYNSFNPTKISNMSVNLIKHLVEKRKILIDLNNTKEAELTGILTRDFYEENTSFFVGLDKQSAKNILITNGILDK